MEVDLEYVLWDNLEERVAAMGVLHEESLASSPSPSNELFRDLFERMAEDVIRASPLSS